MNANQVNFTQAKQDVTDWLANFVEVPHPALGNFPPCPYARNARVNGRIDFRPGVDPLGDLQTVADSGLAGFDVVVYIYNPAQYSGDDFVKVISHANKTVLGEKGLISLSDHPDIKEEALGVCFNQGHYALSVVAEVAGLNSGAAALHERGYYQGWPEEYLELLFEDRQDPRQ